MKKFAGILMITIMASALMVSCKKEVIDVTTLSKGGDEFYFGEKVPVWTGIEGAGGDNTKLSFNWTCSGGYFDDYRTSNLFENLWIAPDSIGEYAVNVKVRNGNAESTKTTHMKVTRYFFDHFYYKTDNAFTGSGIWAQSNNTLNYSKANNSNRDMNAMTLSASSTSGPNLRRTLASPLKAPFSVRTRFAWSNSYRDINGTTARYSSISIYFRQPEANKNYPYIREIRWEFTPQSRPTANYQIRYETFVPATAKSVWSTAGATLPAALPLSNPVSGKKAELTFDKDVFKKLTMSLDKDYVFYAHIDGVLWFQSNGIKDWIADAKVRYPGFEDPIAKEYRFSYPGKGNNSETPTTILMNHVYISNKDGEILQ